MSDRERNLPTIYEPNGPTYADVDLMLAGLKYFGADPRFDIEDLARIRASLQLVQEGMRYDNRLSIGTNSLGLIRSVLHGLYNIGDKIFGWTENKRRYEASHTLSTEPSLASSAQWSIYHPEMDKDLTYQQLKGVQLVNQRKYITLPIKPGIGETYTYIDPSSFIDSRGRRRVVLCINQEFVDSSGHWGYRDLEKWILRDSSANDGGVNSKIVVFHHLETQMKHYTQIRIAGDEDVFEVRYFEPVKTSTTEGN